MSLEAFSSTDDLSDSLSSARPVRTALPSLCSRATLTSLSLTGYVSQQDIHQPTQTVREALLFSARLRQPRDVPDEEKVAYVDTVTGGAISPVDKYEQAALVLCTSPTYPAAK